MKSFPAFGILLGQRTRQAELRGLLEKNSGLPGPRANLELMYSFAHSVAGMHLEEWQWDLVVEMASTSVANAPVNTPKEFVAVCGCAALGALYGAGLNRTRRRTALHALRAAASDSRWRVREAAAMALQLVGESDLEALKAICDDWMQNVSFLELRAVAAGLAHPPLLGDAAFAAYCMEKARVIMAAMAHADRAARTRDDYRVLRQGMGYALSVFVAASPASGFLLMRKLAAQRDSDVAWVIRENLKKKRIADKFPDEVKKVALIADEANAR